MLENNSVKLENKQERKECKMVRSGYMLGSWDCNWEMWGCMQEMWDYNSGKLGYSWEKWDCNWVTWESMRDL
jgi:hypothetical protein